MAVTTHSNHDVPPGPHKSGATGPKTEEGKKKSRGNARKHGLSGGGIALPDEDQAAIDARLDAWTRDLQPRGAVQQALVAFAVLCSVRLDRIAREEAATLAPRVRGARNAFLRTRMGRVLELGRRLTDDPVARCNEELNDLDIPKIVAWRVDEPLLLVMELTETLQGCDWLLDRWREIAGVLDDEGFLHYDNKFKLIRLLGKRPETLLEDRRVGDLVLACRALHPENWQMINEALMTCYGAENRPMYDKRVEALEARLPDFATALNTLRDTIDDEIARLEQLRADLEPVAAQELDEAEDRAALDASPEGALRRRYISDNTRHMHRALAELRKLQTDDRPQADETEESPADTTAPAPSATNSPNEPPKEGERPARSPAIEVPNAPATLADRPERPAES